MSCANTVLIVQYKTANSYHQVKGKSVCKMSRAFATLKNGFKKVSHVIFDLDGLLLGKNRLNPLKFQ